MYLSEIRKAGDQFLATCKGSMVKVVQPVSDKWYWATDENNKLVAKIWDPRNTASEDPWAKCSTGLRPRDRGVLVEKYEFDPDGNPLALIRREIYPTREIGGLWSDYLLLHAEDVEERAGEFVAVRQMKKDELELKARLTKIGFTWPVGTIRRREAGDHNAYASSYESSGLGVKIQDLSSNRRRVKLADGDKYPWFTPHVTVSAQNPEDVDYLLRVLEEGVKVLQRKEARKSARKNGNGQSARSKNKTATAK